MGWPPIGLSAELGAPVFTSRLFFVSWVQNNEALLSLAYRISSSTALLLLFAVFFLSMQL